MAKGKKRSAKAKRRAEAARKRNTDSSTTIQARGHGGVPRRSSAPTAPTARTAPTAKTARTAPTAPAARDAEGIKGQSFLGGAAILAGAAAVVKLIGAVYKIPLNNILGEVGKTYFNTAYNIYNVLLTISTAGLPLAISRLTSKYRAEGRENQKHKLFRVALGMFFLLGLAGSLVMGLGARGIAAGMKVPMAWLPVRALSPAVFCVCLLACMRGYTQGQGNMTPTAASQILEALCKVCIGLPLAWYVLHIGQSLETGAAGAILGVTVGTILSMCFLIVYLRLHRDHTVSRDVPESGGRILLNILLIGVPITLSNSAMSVISAIDLQNVMARLQEGVFLNAEGAAEKAAALYGQYAFAMDMVNMVVAFAYPVTMSLLPTASAALARHDNREVDRIVSAAFRVIILLSFPAAIGLSALSTPIMRFILPAQQAAALEAGPHLQVMGYSVLLIFLMILTNAILQTYGKELIPIFTVIAGGCVKIGMNYLLVGNPAINIHGAPISTLCCYGLIVALNLIFVWKYSPAKPKYLQLVAKPALASVLMGLAVWSFYGLSSRFLAGGGEVSYSLNALCTMVSIGVGGLVYGILVIALGILRAEDLAAMPRGRKIAKFLHLR